MAGLGGDDIALSDGATLVAGSIAPDNSQGAAPNTYKFKVQAPDDSTADLVVSIKDTVTDLSGNALDTTSASVTLAVDSKNPEVATVVPTPGGASDTVNTVAYTVTFSEDVQTLTSADLTIANGSLDTTGLTETSAGSGVYEIPVVDRVATFAVTADQDSVANISVTVKDTVRDVAGNALVSATDTDRWLVDTLNPSVTGMTSDNADGVVSDGDREVTYTVTFSEAVAGLGGDDIALSDGATLVAGSIAPDNSQGAAPNTYKFKVQAPDDSTADLVVSIKDTVTDLSGNALDTTSASVTLAVDSKNPEVATVVPTPGGASDTVNTVAYTVTFSEDVQTLTSADLTIANGSLDTTGLTETSAGSGVYEIPVVDKVATFAVTADQDSVANISVTVKDTVLDVAGNALVECDRYLGDC